LFLIDASNGLWQAKKIGAKVQSFLIQTPKHHFNLK